MEILVTGKIDELSRDFYDALRKQGKVVVCGQLEEKLKGKNLEAFQYDIAQEEFENLFRTYAFDTVIYFSECIGDAVYQEIAQLDRLLTFSRRREHTKVIYIVPDEVVLEQCPQVSKVVLGAGQELCKQHVEQDGSVLYLQVPFLVSRKQPLYWVKECMQRLQREERVGVAYEREQPLDFLFTTDLADFLLDFIEAEENGFLQYNLYGGNRMTMQDLGKQFPNGSISFGMGQIIEPSKEEIGAKYGWAPKTRLADYIENWKKEIAESAEGYQLMAKRWIERRRVKDFLSKLMYLLEFFILFALCEYLTWKTRDMLLVDFADFRLFFIAIAATLYGLKLGGLAAVLASIMYTISREDSINWQIQFYNIVNWLPYATYLLVGTMLGYTKDRYADRVQSAVKSQEIMEEKYVYLNDLYNKVLENKESYGNQIVNYRNSYGRIYAATKQLNSVKTGEIFYHAIAVLEDMLDTANVAIYSLDGGSFARLNACSRGLMEKLTKSLNLDEIPQCRQALESGETWVNKERLEGQPDYAYGVYRDGVLFGMITIWQAGYEQLSIEYGNRFNIVSGLISDALIRATDYQALSEQELMIEGTKIMKYEAFCQEVDIQKRLQENHRAHFILLKVVTQETDYQKLSGLLQHVTRKNDVLGVGQDGTVYILLAQADRGSMDAIYQRMERGGVKVQVLENYELS